MESIYYDIIYAFLSSGGEHCAQTDRLFLILHSARYADHIVYREQGMYCDTYWSAPSDRISVILLFLNK